MAVAEQIGSVEAAKRNAEDIAAQATAEAVRIRAQRLLVANSNRHKLESLFNLITY